MNRVAWQQLKDERIRDALALMAAGQWSATYYLAGYSLECALKVCVTRVQRYPELIFSERRFSEKCWSHNLKELVGLAELETSLAARVRCGSKITGTR